MRSQERCTAIAGSETGVPLWIRAIFQEFMEVRHAPVLLGRLTDLWLVVTGVSLLGCYFFGLAFSRG
jgi:hypothetical protein